MNDHCLKKCSAAESQWHEECGVVGVWAPGEAVVNLCYLALFALQHRGQESAGIAVTNGMHIDVEKGMGLMRDAFKTRVPTLAGHCAIGHVRYSTCGASLVNNVQPIFAYFSGGFISLAHNGSLTNARLIRSQLEKQGCIFQTTTDSEAILNLIARSGAPTIEEKIEASLKQVEGAYCLTIMTGDKLIGARDPHGFRPLCLGQTASGGFVLASETCGLDAVKAKFVRDVAPGEMVVIDKDGVRSKIIDTRPNLSKCVFEYIYFARPDSVFDGLSVWQARYQMGRQLAKQFTGEADIVTPVPDTGITAALGFSAESGLPYVEGLIKNRYVGRTFILPDQANRESTVDMKLNPIRANLEGKRVVLVDDSLVRGTTSVRLVSLIKSAGAKEVHMCISSPPITHPCYYGIDTAVKKELIAAVQSVEEIRRFLGADGLMYLSKEGLMEAVNDAANQCMCTACFTGQYPTSIDDVENSSKG
ncbi:amidophosphoribosyltransferase [Deltaproteobacteria bacterium Smac51]|nr:amidophosphoribosyltransferase [Deltaproteobacteria bacterium Smac51]